MGSISCIAKGEGVEVGEEISSLAAEDEGEGGVGGDGGGGGVEGLWDANNPFKLTFKGLDGGEGSEENGAAPSFSEGGSEEDSMMDQ